jgi:hypothetical protein
VRLEGLDQLKKKSNGLIGNQTRDLPVCSIVLLPTMLPRAPNAGKTKYVFRAMDVKQKSAANCHNYMLVIIMNV